MDTQTQIASFFSASTLSIQVLKVWHTINATEKKKKSKLVICTLSNIFELLTEFLNK